LAESDFSILFMVFLRSESWGLSSEFVFPFSNFKGPVFSLEVFLGTSGRLLELSSRFFNPAMFSV
jgi:hypothetical protein